MIAMTARGTLKVRFTRDWTTRELAHLRARAGRASAATIARELGRTEVAVRRFAKHHGISLKRLGEFHHNAKFSDAQLRAALDMAARGIRHRLIAGPLGVTRRTVSKLVRRERRAA